MSLPRRNGLRTHNDTAATSRVSPLQATTSNGVESKTKSTRSLCGTAMTAASTSSSSAPATDDEQRTMRLRSRNSARRLPSQSNGGGGGGSSCPPSGAEEKRAGSVRSRLVASSGDEVHHQQRTNRSQRDVSSQNSQRSDNIRTTKTSRLRAAALGEFCQFSIFIFRE